MTRPDLPKNTHDIEAVENLKDYKLEELNPILMSLLEWVADINWPIAKPMSKLLKTIEKPLIPHIKTVFSGDDFIWMYWIITYVIDAWDRSLILELESDLLKLSGRYSEGEFTELRALELLIRNKVGEPNEIQRLLIQWKGRATESLTEIEDLESDFAQWIRP